ncbi:MAG: hypothetical protein GXP05_03210 [Alphaproteobacteria bacterium]|nr:hypothetical protein [Alphaproteobacteria bacterium]
MTRLITAFALLAFLSACGGLRQSRLNPSSWFGKSKETKTVVQAVIKVVDARPLVSQVISLKVDRLPGGAIVRAMGLPQTQGYWKAELVPLNGETPDKGTLTYEFRLAPPPVQQAAGTKPSREVLAGTFISDQKLLGVRRIQVIAQGNRRTVRR